MKKVKPDMNKENIENKKEKKVKRGISFATPSLFVMDKEDEFSFLAQSGNLSNNINQNEIDALNNFSNAISNHSIMLLNTNTKGNEYFLFSGYDYNDTMKYIQEVGFLYNDNPIAIQEELISKNTSLLDMHMINISKILNEKELDYQNVVFNNELFTIFAEFSKNI